MKTRLLEPVSGFRGDTETLPRRHFCLSANSNASSLVVTLLVIVVLSTIVVAFMQSMSIERSISKSYLNRERAHQAAAAGLAAARRQILLGVNTNQAFVVGQTNDVANFGPILVIGQTNLTNFPQMIPLISGNISSLSGYPAASSNAVSAYINARTNAAATNTINLNLKNTFIESTSDTNKYRAPWVYLTNSDGTTNSRYAYIVLDEWARINPRYHGNNNLTRDNPTNWFPGMGALPINTGGTNLLSPLEAGRARLLSTNALSSRFTPATIGQAFSSRSAFETKKHLLTLDQTWSPDVIPADLPDHGKPKYNINDLATNTIYGPNSGARANNIASIIATNLPIFGKRDLGLQSEDPTGGKYLRRLAACIIDYIDTDSIPTLVNGEEPAGMEQTPYVVMVAEKNTWVSESSGPAPYTIVIRSEFYAQLWNPYAVPISGDAKLEISRRQAVEMRHGGSLTDFDDFDSVPVPVTLRANEFKAVRFGVIEQNFVNFVNQPSAASDNYPTWAQTSSGGSSLNGHPRFRFYWNNNLAGMNRAEPINTAPAASGLSRNDPGNTFGGIGTIRWSYNCQPANNPNTVADPRITYLSETDWLALGSADTGYNMGSWQGRQVDGAAQRSQDFKTTWNNRDYIPANSLNQGITLSSPSGDPTALTSQYDSADATTFITPVRNGPMQTIAELGNVFDPVQVDNVASNSFSSDNDYHTPGGGYSLRIGQPEYAFASTKGERGIELLDLFTVNSTNIASALYPATRGRINVNTAPQPVLEALFYKISPTSDAAHSNSVVTLANATSLANALIANRPYNKLSDLNKVTPYLANSTNFTPSLSVNVPANANNPDPLAGVFDRAREETFGKIVEFATVQSRAFRIFIVGESLHPVTGKKESLAAAEAILTIQENPPGTLRPELEYLRWRN